MVREAVTTLLFTDSSESPTVFVIKSKNSHHPKESEFFDFITNTVSVYSLLPPSFPRDSLQTLLLLF